ncbi:hypothetical protein ACP9OK_09580 [Pseudomonas sp. B11]
MGTVSNFITTIKNSEQALELFKDGGEVAIDAVLEDKFGVEGVLKDIPILNIAVSMYKMGNKISAYFFAKNMLAFLTEIDRIPNQKRIDFLDKHCTNRDGIENVGEVALMILDKLDHPKLATMLGRVFVLYTLGTITKREFDIYSHAIKSMNPYLQEQLSRFYQSNGNSPLDLPASLTLANYGLLRMDYGVFTSEGENYVSRSIVVTEFGETFYRKILVKGD